MELVVRVDDERLLESLEGIALGLEYFHERRRSATGNWFGRKELPISVCLSLHACYLANEVRSTCHGTILLVRCTRISSGYPVERAPRWVISYRRSATERRSQVVLCVLTSSLWYTTRFPLFNCASDPINKGSALASLPPNISLHPCNAAYAARRGHVSQVKTV